MAAGGDGIISVTANVAPKLMSGFHTAWKNGDIDEARIIQERLMPLHNSLFIETSPAPVKYAASLLNICDEEVRLPLVKPLSETQNKVRDALEKLQLIGKQT